MQEFINITREVKTVTVNIFSIFCEVKQNLGLFAYHLEDLRVPQFENH